MKQLNINETTHADDIKSSATYRVWISDEYDFNTWLKLYEGSDSNDAFKHLKSGENLLVALGQDYRIINNAERTIINEFKLI